MWDEERGALEAPEEKRSPPEAGVLGTPPKGKHQEHVGRQEQGRGVRSRQPVSGTAAGKRRMELSLGRERSPQSPENEGKGRGERSKATRRAGLPGRGGTRQAGAAGRG